MKNEYRLMTNIVALSESKDWDDAKTEWRFTNAFQREGSECLCGKINITNVCVIVNKKNDNRTEVGNCCVKKFMNISNGDTFFSSINKLKKNIKSNITNNFLHHLIDTEFITSDEYRLLSKFQDQNEKKTSGDWNSKIEINQRILDEYCKC
ncbi:hypothetical protein [Pedobacter sp. MR2016-24]|uniref:hypothetical protein n=1 Tax=Pedobacter sp. MR2016-24 TaxID=2994466 RepID=UPI0022480379|nr:hypothetical protein [Pedobacter sp. MR2016-24]MCX2486587.1 hypothetical protein [Pedobacter sp. MR2016-24]